jgi:hypothetical protein
MDGDVAQWMVRWAAMVQTRFKVGSDEKTAWQRMKGSQCGIEVVPFGEAVWWRKLKESGELQNKMEMKWEAGILLGHETKTNEVVIGTPEGCVRAWAVKRGLAEGRWDMGKVNAVRGTPAKPVPGEGGRTCADKNQAGRGGDLEG